MLVLPGSPQHLTEPEQPRAGHRPSGQGCWALSQINLFRPVSRPGCTAKIPDSSPLVAAVAVTGSLLLEALHCHILSLSLRQESDSVVMCPLVKDVPTAKPQKKCCNEVRALFKAGLSAQGGTWECRGLGGSSGRKRPRRWRPVQGILTGYVPKATFQELFG